MNPACDHRRAKYPEILNGPLPSSLPVEPRRACPGPKSKMDPGFRRDDELQRHRFRLAARADVPCACCDWRPLSVS
jgi:hypothetical protein